MAAPTKQGYIVKSVCTTLPPFSNVLAGYMEDKLHYDLHKKLYALLEDVFYVYFNCITDSYYEEGELFWELANYKFSQPT